MPDRSKLYDHKVSKDSVHYSKGHPDSHCAICTHFQKPDHCERVRGTIDPAYWCELFKKAEKR